MRLSHTQRHVLYAIRALRDAPIELVRKSTLRALTRRGLVDHDKFRVRLTPEGERILAALP